MTDTLSDPAKSNVRILLITTLVDELGLQNATASPENISRSRLSAAVRMVSTVGFNVTSENRDGRLTVQAQDLGMDDPESEDSSLRIWNCAMIIDIW